ncbi:MAG TPA: glycosyltransferase family 39 protein, partial [Chthoniobacterales bacterium]
FQLAAATIVLLTVATRLPSLVHPQAIDDEAVYSVVANEIIDGGRPYVDAIERKPPLLFWTYAAIFKVAGKYNWAALHTVALLWTLGAMAGLYVIGRRMFNRETGLIAAFLYSVFQPWGTGKNLAFNGELLMNLPLVWAWAIVFGRSESRLRPELFAAGALLCAGFLLKQPAAIAALPIALYLFLPSYRRSRGLGLNDSIIHAAILTTGFFGALGLVAIVLQRQGILTEAFYWTLASHGIPHVFWERGVLLTLAFIGACLPLVIGAALAFRDRLGLWADKRAERKALLGLVAASMIGTAAGARFYPHYYIQLVPPLALLAAPYFAAFGTGRIKPRFWLVRPAMIIIVLAIAVVAFSISHWRFLLPRREPSETARYINAHSAPNDRIFVWGPEASQFYLHAQRRPASRYVLTFPLTGLIFGGELPGFDTRDRIVPGSWDALDDDFRNHPPLYIIDLESGPDAQYPANRFPVLAKWVEQRYEPVARTGQGVVYRIR